MEVLAAIDTKVLASFGNFISKSNMVVVSEPDTDESYRYFCYCADNNTNLMIHDPNSYTMDEDGTSKLPEPISFIPMKQSEVPNIWTVRNKKGKEFDLYFYNMVPTKL